MVANGQFRNAPYYRVALPSLCERRVDILHLIARGRERRSDNQAANLPLEMLVPL
jgi:transcriptional regulator of acetoin/glycerol metabolism